MFGFDDIPKFFLAFFLVLPAISLVHEAGHVFFAWLMGAKNVKVSIGTGDVIFSIGMLQVRKYYFWYGLCTFENLKRNQRLSNILIFFGGALFNSLATIAVMILIQNEVLEPNILTYQFTYFSLYYVFFALLPMPYPDGNYSDGKVILDLIRNKKSVIKERTYRVQWNNKKGRFLVLDHQNKLMKSFSTEKNAFKKAREIAEKNRPSRIMNIGKEEEREIENFPRIPL